MLDPAIKELAQAKNFAMLSFHLANGAVATQVMWVDADDEHVLMNTEVHRAKYKALQVDPRVTVTVWDNANPYHYAEVRGRLADTETGPEARAMIDRLAHTYTGKDHAAAIQSERVILRIAPERQLVR
jgi:PPOX class probable F420-dependent enzyme